MFHAARTWVTRPGSTLRRLGLGSAVLLTCRRRAQACRRGVTLGLRGVARPRRRAHVPRGMYLGAPTRVHAEAAWPVVTSCCGSAAADVSFGPWIAAARPLPRSTVLPARHLCRGGGPCAWRTLGFLGQFGGDRTVWCVRVRPPNLFGGRRDASAVASPSISPSNKPRVSFRVEG